MSVKSELREKRLERIKEARILYSPKYRGVYDAATNGQGARRAIRSKCIDCCGYSGGREISECPVTSCSLWLYRMGKKIDKYFL